MQIKSLNNSAFSLLEILLAAIIFVVSVAGVFATLNTVRAPVVTKENSLTAAVFGKQVLEALRSQVSQTTDNYYACSVNQNTCPDFSLWVGQHQVSSATLSANGLTWPTALTGVNGGANPVLNYKVTCADGSVGPHCANADVAHRVDLNICLDAAC